MFLVKYAAYLVVSLGLALIPAYFVTWFVYMTYTKYQGSRERDAAVEKARAEGRAVTARLVTNTVSDNGAPHSSYCKYKFIYNGKKYCKRVEWLPGKKRELPPETMEFYFRKSPKHAKLYDDFGKLETETKYVFAVVWILTAVIISVWLLQRAAV